MSENSTLTPESVDVFALYSECVLDGDFVEDTGGNGYHRQIGENKLYAKIDSPDQSVWGIKLTLYEGQEDPVNSMLMIDCNVNALGKLARPNNIKVCFSDQSGDSYVLSYISDEKGRIVFSNLSKITVLDMPDDPYVPDMISAKHDSDVLAVPQRQVKTDYLDTQEVLILLASLAEEGVSFPAVLELESTVVGLLEDDDPPEHVLGWLVPAQSSV